MLKDLNEDTALKFKNLSAEEKSARCILGRLYGPVASFTAPTRNTRKYSIDLWEKLFNSDLIKERFKNGGIFGQLCHPDYSEVDMEKIAIVMPEPPVKDKDGQLIAYVDIVDTPCGRIAYQLAKYGYKFGISSRGEGDIITDYDGNESVDPDTYTLNAFDLVEIPAVESARLCFTESFNGKTLKQALNEQLDSANAEDKKIMEESLKALNINITSKASSESNDSVAENNGMDIIKDLQEALKHSSELEKTIAELQEKLSVSYAKEMKLYEDVQKYKKAVISLSESSKNAKALNSKIHALEEELANKDVNIKQKDDEILKLNESMRVDRFNEIKASKNVTKLQENISEKVSTISDLKNQVVSLTEALKEKYALEKTNDSLVEEVETLKKDSYIKNSEYTKKIADSNKLVEKYQSIARTAVDKYITCQANRIGVTANEIKSRLNENYSFNDIDTVCESLKDYKLNISKLPFDIKPKTIKAKVNESKDSMIPKNMDDEVDSQLMRLANLN